jgi:hypothetical protein
MTVERRLAHVHGGSRADDGLEGGHGDPVGEELCRAPFEEEEPVVRELRQRRLELLGAVPQRALVPSAEA